MIKQNIYLKEYKWYITVFYNTSIDDLNDIINKLKEMDISKNDLYLAYENIIDNKINTGFIYTNFKKRETLITIGKANSKEEFINTVVHEANHLQSHIATYYNIDEKGEEVSYLIGDIVKRMYSIFKKIIH